ncbi:sulfite reductase (NADPH) hemoprotein beta-component [Filimonas lacunae]|uniref:assimilatory sulfite reductase (NADPH) n=1 Tax=Filimonas lacunae TaxID=477680 RepID=A0A173MMV5_9BACT|nr:NADPH-dependent assimilatory sulfite reductase hemoprotein subunit [Filimonas lacunae]BAV08799.1 sulfite reductase [NADPH] hemoprotein beta-component [Filimonas lacunae]SIS61925.1 sulfite reductase (NADPH) hemoprotein beta-component [Filimonas lacunae]
MKEQQLNLSPIEKIKQASDGLRGTLKESLQEQLTGALYEDDQALVKFHGMYQQDDRDRREERSAKKLEWLYSYMIRLRLPGGFITGEQWEALHHIAGEHATGVIKITTRQTIQLHGILKSHVKPTIQDFHTAGLDSISACGDVNRNVICAAHPKQSAIHEQVFAYADKLSQLGLPKTRAYYEIWLDEQPLTNKKEEEDDLYQDRYLPRKFKMAIVIPPNNDVDVFANDLGLIAVIENNELKGFNIAAGGGLGTTHGNPNTYPRLATVLGFVDTEEKVLKAAYEIITIQRDYGNRSDRKMSRLKYTIDKMGVEEFKAELEKRCGFTLAPARPYAFTERVDYFGWQQNHEGKWYYTVFAENGRVMDTESLPLKTALLEVAKTRKANFRFTANQKLILADISAEDKELVHGILEQYGIIVHTDNASSMRKNAVACVAFNTCPLALAEAQRYLPTLIGKIEPLLQKHKLGDDAISVRMTGCPNGCGRPYVAEIGFIGTGYGHYNMHIGGDREGTRLNLKYKENINEETILEELDGLLGKYSKKRKKNETFGDFVIREKIIG